LLPRASEAAIVPKPRLRRRVETAVNAAIDGASTSAAVTAVSRRTLGRPPGLPLSPCCQLRLTAIRAVIRVTVSTQRNTAYGVDQRVLLAQRLVAGSRRRSGCTSGSPEGEEPSMDGA
jgi:hypothetical protein